MASSSRNSITAAIAAEEGRLAALDREREGVQSRLEQLGIELAALDDVGALREATAPFRSPPSSLTSAEKVALFRSLFRGRDDVYPKLWENARTGKKGYAPSCANEWVRGRCEKPRVKCGECPNQAFLAVTDQVIFDHLQGRHVIGVYALLEDETCWFLAVDFDKQSWMEDVAAFVQTCRSARIPVAIERSRSGNGAHAWFFFAGPVPAALARKLGCFLITETMARRHELSMNSYDRLFPNQDTMPRGGFGNLIALPLQYEARQQGNTVFLDDRFSPQADQWAYLAGIDRIAPSTVERIAAEATRKGQVIGVRSADLGDNEENRAPWNRPPSERAQQREILGSLPQSVSAVLAQRIFVEKAGMPSALLNQIKRLAAFQNPEFYKKQRMRLSTALTPRVMLRPAARNLVVLRGGMGARQRREVAERIAAISPTEERLVLATGRYIGEGFDDARLDTLFLTLPVSWKGTLVQYAGRLHRAHAGKHEVRIFDYADREVPMLARMFAKRLRGYRAIGYEQRELPAGYEGVPDEPVIEWDEEALRTFKDSI